MIYYTYLFRWHGNQLFTYNILQLPLLSETSYSFREMGSTSENCFDQTGTNVWRFYVEKY